MSGEPKRDAKLGAAGRAGAPRGDVVSAGVLVRVPQPQAFELFTQRIDAWWRRGLRFRHSGSATSLMHLEPGVGGRLFERLDAAGGEALIEVGRVLVWTPPEHLAFSWRTRGFRDGESTRVDVHFEPREGATWVQVRHSGWAAVSADAPVRHGQDVSAFVRGLGLWWGAQLAALREMAPPR